jgi:competence protein ComEC
VALLVFFALRTVSFMQSNTRQQLIVYNVPQKQAIDFIAGRKYFFVGDSDLLADDFVRNFHLKPSRILHRMEPAESIDKFSQSGNLINYRGKRIMRINESCRFSAATSKIAIDLLLISGNPRLNINKIAESFSVNQVVFDGSCPAWKIKYWNKDCDSLHIPTYDVNEKGAFVMNLR